MQTAAGGEFLSPSGNISREVEYHRAGQQCLGNPGTGTPTLAYGTQTGVGPFRCESASTGITCVAGGQGFRISTSGVMPVPA